MPPLHSFTFPLHSWPLFEFNLVTPEAEKFNGWMAMIGFIAAFGAYATTGQIIPGIF
ncbi:high light inducible protein hli11 [Prochlorococcus marinus str. PAC1]|mgnify:FL=1|uniref:High light inducible protein hli11 n=1 Tax=Prochlorococcus marinus str. PAC1 TaxID=59924 RepID=A0A0A2C8M0_PROMR|nr:high light inducible protein hli11 [Prochlorococcus marinus str. PAC1]